MKLSQTGEDRGRLALNNLQVSSVQKLFPHWKLFHNIFGIEDFHDDSIKVQK